MNKISKEDLINGISNFNSKVIKDTNGTIISRNESWNILYELTKEYILGNKDDYDLYTLNLCMYLASWGMYRGSTKLLQKFNYRALIPISKIVLDNKYHKLYNLKTIEDYTPEIIDLICELYLEIKNELEHIFSYASSLQKTDKYTGNKVDVSSSGVTKTLITKIMLGTYGCIVAYDTYISEKLGELGIVKSISSPESLKKSIVQTVDLLKEIDFKNHDKRSTLIKSFDMALFGIGI